MNHSTDNRKDDAGRDWNAPSETETCLENNKVKTSSKMNEQDVSFAQKVL